MLRIHAEKSQDDWDKIFGVKEVPDFSTNGLELRYEAEAGQEGDPDYLKEQIFRDENGNYFLAAKGGINATIGFETPYYLDGREVLIPICPEALAGWAGSNLCGEEYAHALEEFKIPETFEYKTVWLFQQGVDTSQQGFIFEFLWKTADGLYVLFSTDASYPAFGHIAPFTEFGEGGTCRDDLYMYFLMPETAQRWAEARGMAEADCQMAFDC